MWSDRCRWSSLVKIAVSLAAIAALCVAVALMVSSSGAPASGVILVDSKPRTDVLGPEAPDDLPEVEPYNPLPTTYSSVMQSSPPPVYVYYNIGGVNYHTIDCRFFIHGKSHKVTLDDALNAGLTRCKTCDAPSEGMS